MTLPAFQNRFTGIWRQLEGIKKTAAFLRGCQLGVDYHLHPYHDITQGNNLFYPATANYDLATGFGSPNIELAPKNWYWTSALLP